MTDLMDGMNRRVGKFINGNLQSRYLYDGQLRVVSELNNLNEITKVYLYGDSANVPEAMVMDGTKYLLIKDLRGSVRQVVNADTGVLEQELSYDDWGHVTSDSNPGFQPFGFAGGLYDPETGLVRFGARDYDGVTGRWLSKDPILFNGGDTNLYGYVLNDPINLVDPEGKIAVITVGVIGISLLAYYYQEEITNYLCSLSNTCSHKKYEQDIQKQIQDLIQPIPDNPNQCFPRGKMRIKDKYKFDWWNAA